MLRRTKPALVALLFQVLAAGCGSGAIDALRPTDRFVAPPCLGAQSRGTVRMQFYGTAGFKIQWHDQALLTGPFFSNPTILDILLGRAPSNEAGKKLADQVQVDDVRGVIVGQAHYDHLADVPLIAPRLPASAKIWVSRTGRYLLEAAGVPSGQIEELNAIAGNWRHVGKWIPIGDSIRVMALHSEHAPHFMGMKFLTGHLDAPLGHRPEKASDWVEGQTFTFIIDLLDRDASGAMVPVFRMHYRDSASNPPWGFHPPLPDDKRVDVAMICAASFPQVKDYPEALVRDLQPRYVVIDHWENFFRPQSDPLQVVPGIDPKEFVVRLKSALPADADWVTPKPGGTLEFPVCD